MHRYSDITLPNHSPHLMWITSDGTHVPQTMSNVCEILWHTAKMSHREKQKNSSEIASTNSHANYRYLQPIEKEQWLHNLHTRYRSTKTKLDGLRVKIAQATSDSGIQLDERIHDDMVNMLQLSWKVHTLKPEGSFQRILWEEQKKAVLCKDSYQVWWHPLIIKWCLYMRHRSSGAYETLWSSGLLKLPSQRTLWLHTLCESSCRV